MNRNRRLGRALSLFLILALLLATFAGALTVEQARELLNQHYVDELPSEILGRPTVEEILAAIGDPYTEYLTAGEYQAFLDSMNDSEVVGIGVSVQSHALGILITGTTPGSPAEGAGLVPGDIITAVDGQSAEGLSSDAIAVLIRGEEGTSVSVTVLREDGASKTVSMKRAALVIPVTSSLLLDKHIGVITCDAFGDQTVSHFQQAISDYDSAADHWIVDLRLNPGGAVNAVADSLGLFLGQGIMVYYRDRTGEYSVSVSRQESQTLSPLVVLTSGWSASGSEVFAAAVKDYQAGAVIGGRTFGKGVGQSLLDSAALPAYFDDGSALKVTTVRWFSPLGNTCDQMGVFPHLLISDEHAADAAYLLCATAPVPDQCPNYLRIDLGSWRFFIHLETALSAEYRPAFTELLEACAPATPLFTGTASGKWTPVTAAEVAQRHGLSEYAPRSFSDTGGSEYEAQISTLAAFDIVKGAGDGTYHPSDNLTRAELCALLAQAMNYRPVSGPGAFSDVAEDAWYAPYVNALHAMGIVSGYDDGLFHPLDPISHEQFFAIFARAAQRISVDFYEAAKEVFGQEFFVGDDLSGYSAWAREYVWLLSQSQRSFSGPAINYLYAEPGEIDPLGATLREEAAALLHNLLVYTGILAG